MTRSEARCEAFKLIFQIEAHKEDFAQIVEIFIEENADMKKSDKKQFNYIINTANGAYAKFAELDTSIESNLTTDWKLPRLSRVSLAILRLAAYEILCAEDIPDSVAVNEAVELAKIYDEDAAPSFINGVISGIIKSKEQQ